MEEEQKLQRVLKVKDLREFLESYKGDDESILTVWDLETGERFPITCIDPTIERHLEFNFQPDISKVKI